MASHIGKDEAHGLFLFVDPFDAPRGMACCEICSGEICLPLVIQIGQEHCSNNLYSKVDRNRRGRNRTSGPPRTVDHICPALDAGTSHTSNQELLFTLQVHANPSLFHEFEIERDTVVKFQGAR